MTDELTQPKEQESALHEHAWARISGDLYGCECGARGHVNTMDEDHPVKECHHAHVA